LNPLFLNKFHTVTGQPLILAIESSCDETSAAVLRGSRLLSNVIATQETVHRFYGGVVPELASRAHQQKIIPVVHEALVQAKITKNDLSAVAFTRGPGLMGALLVGVSFAKAMALALDIPLVEVNHMQGHVLAHFIQDGKDDWPVSRGGMPVALAAGQDHPAPSFPFLCLTVSGGHTQIVRVNGFLDMQILGQTLDDAAGEAFDKAAKVMGLPYPGGVLIDRLSDEGNETAFRFPHPSIPGLDFSFSGLKTAFLNFIKKHSEGDAAFVEKHKADICASYQKTIVDVLLDKLKQASEETGITQIALAGGVSANRRLRRAVQEAGGAMGWTTFVPPLRYCTDNAAMIASAGYYRYALGHQDQLDVDILPTWPLL
jgi:N6-L-threonylcarbamoyladenine synthase